MDEQIETHLPVPRLPKTVPCHDPATGKLLGDVPAMDRDEVVSRVQRAREAQKAWGAATFSERRAVLKDVLDYIVKHQDEICRLAALDSGKTMVDAAMGEVFPVCEKLRYCIANGERDLRPQRRGSGFLLHKTARVEYHPLGVAGVICPWNFPFHNLFCPAIPALFAGNAVVAKVSEYASWSAADYVEIFHQALRKHGFSTDLVQVVTGWGDTGAALVGSGVDKIFFTGSPQNGKKVMEEASKTLTPVVLELGGKDPMIVCDDADLKRVSDAAMLGVFTASGQMCVAVERFYVHDAVYDRFVSTLSERVARLVQGPPLESLVDIGALTMPRQAEIIEDLVQDAIAKGARAIVGGKRNTRIEGGTYFEPTLLVDVDHSMRITQEEHFGPIMLVIRVRDDEEAIRLANDTPYGLGSSVFSRDARRAESIQRRIRAGMTVINDYGIAYMMQSLPFGGIGISGFGKINGREGLRSCCLEKAVVDDRLPIGKSISFHPVRERSYHLVESAVRLIYGASVRDRARAALDAARNLASVARDAKNKRR